MNTTAIITSKRVAKIRLQLALMLARDLRLVQTADPSRFSRMVDGKGKSVMNEKDAESNIRELIQLAAGHYPVTCRWLARWLESEGDSNE